MLVCCECRFWRAVGNVEDATYGYCRYRAPAAILPHSVSAMILAEHDKFELGERDVPPRGFQPIHPITNALWGCGEGELIKEQDDE